MRFKFFKKNGSYWELCIGFNTKQWSSMYFISLMKWVREPVDIQWECEDEPHMENYPCKIHFWGKHPKYWRKLL